MRLTDHFSLPELIRSDYAIRHGINNMPADAEVLENLHTLARGLERVRAVIGAPVHVTSGYRCPKLNSAIGGSKTSAHMRGLAADIVVHGLDAFEVCQMIAAYSADIGFDQLIQEGGWTHIAFPDVDRPRGEILTAHFFGGKVSYTKGLV